MKMYVPQSYSRSNVDMHRAQEGSYKEGKFGSPPPPRGAISYPNINIYTAEINETNPLQRSESARNPTMPAEDLTCPGPETCAWKNALAKLFPLAPGERERVLNKKLKNLKKKKPKTLSGVSDRFRMIDKRGIRNILVLWKILLVAGTLLYFIYSMCLLMTLSPTSTEISNNFHGVVAARNKEEYYKIPEAITDSVTLTLTGPFLSESDEKALSGWSGSEREFIIRLDRWLTPRGDLANRKKMEKLNSIQIEQGTPVKLAMVDSSEGPVNTMDPLDYQNEKRHATPYVGKSKKSFNNKTHEMEYVLTFCKHARQMYAVPFSFMYETDPLAMYTRMMVSLTPLITFNVLLVLQWSLAIACIVGVTVASGSYMRLGVPLQTNEMLQWINLDYTFYYVLLMMYNNVLTDTNIHSFLAYHYLKFTKFRLWSSVLLVVLVSGAGSLYFQSQFIAMMVMPLAVRLMELSSLDVKPMLIVLIMTCNIMGRARKGTFAFKEIILHRHIQDKIAKESEPDVTSDLMKATFLSSMVVFVVCIIYIFVLQTAISRPFYISRRREVAEAEKAHWLWKNALYTAPPVSRRWGHIYEKVQTRRRELLEEKRWVEDMNKPPPKYFPYVMDLHGECKIGNCFLLFKFIILVVFFVALVDPYITNKPSHFAFLEQPKKANVKTYSEMTLGIISMYLILLVILMLHAQELELIFKRLDFEAILVFMSIHYMVGVTWELTRKATTKGDKNSRLASFLYSSLSQGISGRDKSSNVHFLAMYILMFTLLTGFVTEMYIFPVMLDTILTFTTKDEFSSLPITLGCFVLGTYYWGMATRIGTPTGLLITGRAWFAGHGFKYFRYFFYGFPISVISIIILYLFVIIYHLPGVK